jgi:hypothetical protein
VRRSRRSRAAVTAALAACSFARGAAASAEPNDAAGDAPSPPTLPALAHREMIYSVEHTVAVLRPAEPAASGGRSLAWLVHSERRGLARRRRTRSAARAASAEQNPLDLTARATLSVGYRVTPTLGVGLEVWEVYLITADVPDDKRAAFAVSPSVRLLLGRVQPALSLLLPIATPLRGDVESYVAARLHVDFAFDVLAKPRRDGRAAAPASSVAGDELAPDGARRPRPRARPVLALRP